MLILAGYAKKPRPVAGLCYRPYQVPFWGCPHRQAGMGCWEHLYFSAKNAIIGLPINVYGLIYTFLKVGYNFSKTREQFSAALVA